MSSAFHQPNDAYPFIQQPTTSQPPPPSDYQSEVPEHPYYVHAGPFPYYPSTVGSLPSEIYVAPRCGPIMSTLPEFGGSFESSGSFPVPPVVWSASQGSYPEVHRPIGIYPVTGGYHRGYAPQWHPASQLVSPIVEYIENIMPEDVLSGRGGATNSHSGNRAFRSLVKGHQERYLQAKKRDKPAVASKIVEMIRKKNGRFLRRCETNPQGKVLWIDIGDDRAREKTCQALREGAPEIRKRDPSNYPKDKAAPFIDTNDIHENESDSSPKDTTVLLGSRSSSRISLGYQFQGDDCKLPPKTIRQTMDSPVSALKEHVLNDGGDNCNEYPTTIEGPIMIRPLVRLLSERPHVDPIPLDHLSAQDRDIYLQNFLPPFDNQDIYLNQEQRPRTVGSFNNRPQHYENPSADQEPCFVLSSQRLSI